MALKYFISTLLLLCSLLLAVQADVCVSQANFAVQSTNGRLEVSGAAITIKGLNWWGMETGSFHVGGLQTQSLTFYMDFLQKNGFNGLRIPFALDMVLNPTKRFPNGINYNVNPDLEGLTAIEILDKIFSAAASRGIVILLDQHRFDVSQSDSTPLWYTTSCITNPDGQCVSYTIADDKNGWDFMINRYKSYWNLFGVDLANEPHGATTWGTGASTDWALASAEIGNHIIDTHPDWKGMIFVEGIESNPSCQILGCNGCNTDGHWWGGSLEGLRCAGVALKDPTRLVFSPHVYSVSVFDQPYFSTPDFPSNLPYIYDTHFGFAINKTGRAVVIGEWGGPLIGRDQVIQNTQSNYFKSRGIDSSFYWALNPNPGGDTDGVFNDDWTTSQTAKLNFLATAHPTPTKFSASDSQVCVSGAGQDVPPTSAPATQAPTKSPTAVPPTQPPTIAPTVAPGATAAPTSTPKPATVAPTVPAEHPQGGYNDITSASASSSSSSSGSASASSSSSSSSSSGSGSTTSGSATTSSGDSSSSSAATSAGSSTTADPSGGSSSEDSADSSSGSTTSSVAPPGPPSVPTASPDGSDYHTTSAASGVAVSSIALLGLLAVLL